MGDPVGRLRVLSSCQLFRVVVEVQCRRCIAYCIALVLIEKRHKRTWPEIKKDGKRKHKSFDSFLATQSAVSVTGNARSLVL